jgi:hypothetical protein
MQTQLRAGATIDMLTPGEFKKHLGDQIAQTVAEWAIGVKPMRFQATGTVANDLVTIPAAQNGQLKLGPSPGFLWKVERISAYGLASGDVLQVHRTETDGSAFLGNLTAATGYLHIGGEGMLLYGGESIVLTGASLTATGQIIVNGEGVEVPALMLWKVV